MRTRVKVCGMTQPDNVAKAIEAGVDAIGIILHAKSPRTISVEQAIEIRKVVPAFVSLVGVFVDCPLDRINQVSERLELDLVQLHGDETNEFALGLDKPFIKAIRAKTTQQVSQSIDAYPNSRAILLDPYVSGQHGGTGKRLDVGLWPQSASDKKLILAGGLSATNVAEAVKDTKPFGVDLNSGLETSPGVKDISLLKSALESLV